MTFNRKFATETLAPLCLSAYSEVPILPVGVKYLAPITIDPHCVLAAETKLLNRIVPQSGNFGFVARSDHRIFVCIPGTKDLQDWFEDLASLLIDWHGIGIHSGFNEVASAVTDSILAALTLEDVSGEADVWVVGHSLGAAVATLVALRIPHGAHLFTIASPRVGTRNLSVMSQKVITTSIRVANTRDIVTHVPPRPVFSHIPFTISVDGWKESSGFKEKIDVLKQHSIERTYIPALGRLPEEMETVVLS
jgi:alpha/beta superfamily hydrolase